MSCFKNLLHEKIYPDMHLQMSFAPPRRQRSMVVKLKKRVAAAYSTPISFATHSLADTTDSFKKKRKRRTVRKREVAKETYYSRRRNLLLLEENRRMQERWAERQRIRTSKKRKEHSQRMKFISKLKKRMSNPCYFPREDGRSVTSAGRIRTKHSPFSKSQTQIRPKSSQSVDRFANKRPQTAMPRLSRTTPTPGRYHRRAENNFDLTGLNTGLNGILFHQCAATVPITTPDKIRGSSGGSRREMIVKMSDIQSRQATMGISITLSSPGESTKHTFVVRETLRALCVTPDLAPLRDFLQSNKGALEPRLQNQLKDAFVNCILSRLYLDSVTEKPCISRHKIITKTIDTRWASPRQFGGTPVQSLEPMANSGRSADGDPPAYPGVPEPEKKEQDVLEAEESEQNPGVPGSEESSDKSEQDTGALETKSEHDPRVPESEQSSEKSEQDPGVLELLESEQDPGVPEPEKSQQDPGVQENKESTPEPVTPAKMANHQVSLLRKSVPPNAKNINSNNEYDI